MIDNIYFLKFSQKIMLLFLRFLLLKLIKWECQYIHDIYIQVFEI